MGKLAKQQKKRKLVKADESAMDIDSDPENLVHGIQKINLEITIQTLAKIQNLDIIHHKEFQQLRQLLFSLNKKRASLPSLITDALRDARWNDAIHDLKEMRISGRIPKLGSVQRWVRDCDASFADCSNSDIFRVLDAILRTSDPDIIKEANINTTDKGLLILHPSWLPEKCPQQETEHQIHINVDECFREIYRVAGADRNPQNEHDMILYHSIPNTIKIITTKKVNRHNVPNLPGVFILSNVLSSVECNLIIQAAETLGFTPDVPVGGSAKTMPSILAHNFFWIPDNDFVSQIYLRCLPFLPQGIQGCAIAGLNARWRVYRYRPGSIYRPHIDGAWPGSGLKDGEYVYDIYGDRWSKLTFLIRLNDDFEGGDTTFFMPSIEEGKMHSRGVRTFQGDVIVFPHGDTSGTILHEGSAVMKTGGRDTKYVIRTEVLYMVPGH